MEAKKDIGKVYKEALQDYKIPPHNRVWKNIEEQLNKPKRRILPYWLLISSITLLLTIPASIYLYNNSSKNETKTSNNNNTPVNNVVKTKNTEAHNNSPNNNEILITKDVNDTTKEKNTNTTLSTNNDINKLTKRKNQQVNQYKKGRSTTKINNQHSLKHTNDKNLIYQNSNSKEITITLEKAIHFKSLPIIRFDSLPSHNLRFAKTIKEKKKEKSNNKNNYHVKAYGGITYFNSLSKGYSIDESLLNNKTKSNIGYNYGAALVYDFTKTFSISFGIGKTFLSYTVKSADSTSVQNNLINSPNFRNINLNSSQTNTLGSFSTIDLTQQLSYLEFPIYYYYSPLKKRLRFNMYGGPTFLALLNNDIIANSSNGNSLKIGNVNNLGKFSIGLNLGVGLSYKLSEKLIFTTESGFRYHINTFNNNSSFKPYSINLNLGVKYRF